MLGRAKRQLKRALGPMVRRYRPADHGLPPAQWGLDVSPEGGLTYQGVDLAALRRQWGSPLHVVLAERLKRNVADFLAVNSAGKTRAEIFYSYKSNPVPGVLRFLHERGIGAEVISEYELWLAIKLGVPPDRIIYNGPAKSEASIREAVAKDILLLNVNHREEIAIVAAVARELGKRPRVGVRVTSSAGWAGQFGLAIDSGEAFAALREVHENETLELAGLHCHVGGMVRGVEYVEGPVSEVLALADRVKGELGLELPMLDLGGSLATPSVSSISELDRRLCMSFQAPLPAPSPEATAAIKDYVASVTDRVEAHYAAEKRPVPRIFFEPGRAMTGNAQILIASVLSVRECVAKPDWAILDAGINVAEPVRSEYHQLFAATRMREPHDFIYRLAGPICSPGDVLSWSASLPKLSAGDALAIMDAGAYFVPFATSFSFPQPAIVMLNGNETQLLRRSEVFDDLIDRDAVQ